MARAYSLDLRERVVAAVLSGQSCRAVGVRFGVSVASVVKWSQRFRATGSVAAKPMGGRARTLVGERSWILARLEAVPDLTLRALVAELQERGVMASYGSVWRTVHEAGITFKKNSVRDRARSSGRRAKAHALEGPSGPV
jgi:transposase